MRRGVVAGPVVETGVTEEALWIVGWSALLQRLIDDIDAASDALDAVVAGIDRHAWLFASAGHPARG